MWSLLAFAADRPNVVLITLDTTRADALSCYGVAPGPYRVETRTTPNLDALAAEGARFEAFFAHRPSTLSSHAPMFTGLRPHGHAVVRKGSRSTGAPGLARGYFKGGNTGRLGLGLNLKGLAAVPVYNTPPTEGFLQARQKLSPSFPMNPPDLSPCFFPFITTPNTRRRGAFPTRELLS